MPFFPASIKDADKEEEERTASETRKYVDLTPFRVPHPENVNKRRRGRRHFRFLLFWIEMPASIQAGGRNILLFLLHNNRTPDWGGLGQPQLLSQLEKLFWILRLIINGSSSRASRHPRKSIMTLLSVWEKRKQRSRDRRQERVSGDFLCFLCWEGRKSRDNIP